MFQRVMQQMLIGVEGVDCFIDDIVVWGETHDQRLKQVLEKCKMNGLTLNGNKWQLRSKEVKFFGHILSSEGLKPDMDKTTTIASLDCPRDKDELRRFMGMIGYLAKFLPDVAQRAGPLRELLREDTNWAWSEQHQQSYSRLKQLVTQTPVLAFFNSEAKTIVSADASSYGLGATLFQLQADGRKAPVIYTTRALNDKEKQYAQIEKEALALVWACERFDCYLLGREDPLVVETDHKPLVTILNKQTLDQCSPRIQRLKMRMMKFHFEVVYVPGKQLVVADMLSRQPLGIQPGDAVMKELVLAVEEHVHEIKTVLPASESALSRFREATSSDPEMMELLRVIHSGWPDHVSQLPIIVRPYWCAKEMLTEVDGIILRGQQIVVPKCMRPEMVQLAHEGHLGITKTKRRAREAVWWPGMNSKLEETVSNCLVCVRFSNEQRREPLVGSPLPGRPWEKVGVDLFDLGECPI